MSEKDIKALGYIQLAELELHDATIAIDEGKPDRAEACLAKALWHTREAEMVYETP